MTKAKGGTECGRGKWVLFSPIDAEEPKTKAWVVHTMMRMVTGDKSDRWGEIKFKKEWRKYAFYPVYGMAFETDCLRDIATFCARKSREWRKEHP